MATYGVGQEVEILIGAWKGRRFPVKAVDEQQATVVLRIAEGDLTYRFHEIQRPKR